MENLEFTPTVRRPYPPFYAEMMTTGEAAKEEWKKFIGREYAVRELMMIEGVWYYPNYHLKEFVEELITELFENEKLFIRMKDDSLGRERKLHEAVKGSYEEYCSAYYNYMVTLATYFVCDDFIEDKVKEMLSQRVGDEQKVTELMHYLTIPLEDNYNVKEKLYLVQTEDLEEHGKKFGWLCSRYGLIREYPKEEAGKLLKELKEGNFLEKYKKQKEKVKEAVRTAKEALGEKGHAIDIMQFFIYYRTQRTDVMNKSMYYFAPKLKKIAKDKGLEYEELLYCTKKEIDESRIPSRKEIKERMKKHSSIMNENGFRIVTGRENEELKERFIKKIAGRNHVQGRTAHRGTAVGTAKIIMHLDDIKKIEHGDVLITNMTTPNMVPAMQKAVAFVTDEGGITCHASIIAREMKKPCIIGTGVATKVFKDGDRIKVDAENGKVFVI